MIPSNSLVFLIDDDASVRRGVSRLLRSAGYKNEAFRSASDFLAREQHSGPACLIVDVRMPELNGMDLQSVLVQRRREEQLVFITGHGDISMCAQAMKAGAVDFIEKPFEKEALLASLDQGFGRLSRKEATDDRKRDAEVRLQALTARERDVLNGLAQGLPNKTIAYDLGISPRTVEIHRANLMTKLEVRSLSEALRIAFAAQGE